MKCESRTVTRLGQGHRGNLFIRLGTEARVLVPSLALYYLVGCPHHCWRLRLDFCVLGYSLPDQACGCGPANQSLFSLNKDAPRTGAEPQPPSLSKPAHPFSPYLPGCTQTRGRGTTLGNGLLPEDALHLLLSPKEGDWESPQQFLPFLRCPVLQLLSTSQPARRAAAKKYGF